MYILNNSDNFFFHRKKPAPGPPQGWIKKNEIRQNNVFIA
jgi:hypothetical protein